MNGLASYKENSVTTQTGGRLVVLLYDGAIKFLRQAIVELEAGHFMEKGQFINKAVAIIDELNTTLNMEVGGEVAQNLRKLYQFMTRQLHQANIQRDVQKIQQVMGLLNELNSGWKQITQ